MRSNVTAFGPTVYLGHAIQANTPRPADGAHSGSIGRSLRRRKAVCARTGKQVQHAAGNDIPGPSRTQRRGYPIVGDENGQLSHPRLLDRTVHATARIQLTEEEIAALLLAARHQGPHRPFGKALLSASTKLGAMAAAKKQSLATELDQAIASRSRARKDYSGHEATILRLVEAIICRRICRVSYKSPRGEAITYPYHPYQLLTVDGGLYCLGRVPAYDTITTLAVERIRELQATDEAFTVDTNFDLDRYSNEDFGVVWEEPMTVVLRFHPDQASYLAEREWHPSQRLKTLPGGGVELTLHAGGLYEIVRWILGWGDAVEVLRPVRLRHAVAEKLRSAAHICARA